MTAPFILTHFLVQFINYLNILSFKGRQVAEQGNEGDKVNPEGELQQGTLVKEFDYFPYDKTIENAIKENGGNPSSGWDSKKGKLLDESVQTGR